MITWLDDEQGSAEWLASRAGLLTASMFKVAIGSGQGRQTLLYKLAGERMTGQPERGFVSDDMRRGTELEPVARLAYEIEHDADVRQVGLAINDLLGLGASLDGLIDNKTGLEIKCPRQSTMARYLASPHKLPSEYRAQVLGQMLVCELDAVEFFAWHPLMPAHRVIVLAEQYRQEIEQLQEGLIKFNADLNTLVERITP